MLHLPHGPLLRLSGEPLVGLFPGGPRGGRNRPEHERGVGGVVAKSVHHRQVWFGADHGVDGGAVSPGAQRKEFAA